MTTTNLPKCRWVASDQPRAVIGEHYDECDGTDCRGCWPCLVGHCLICRREHTDEAHSQTCASCVGAVREDLELIVDMFARLEDEAISKGMAGDGEETVLGGDAMVMLAMRYREQTGAASDGDKSHESKTDPVPPLLTLATWEDCYRDHLGHDQAGTASVDAAAGYLSRQLTHIAQDSEVPFEDFARDIRQTRGRLEDVLHDGERIERGAPCPACREDGDEARPLVQERNDRDVTGASDRWVCRSDRAHWWNEAGYRLRIGTEYRAHSDKLTAPDMAEEHEVKASSVRAWASLGKVRKRGKDANGRQLYDVVDVLRMRDGHAEGESA